MLPQIKELPTPNEEIRKLGALAGDMTRWEWVDALNEVIRTVNKINERTRN